MSRHSTHGIQLKMSDMAGTPVFTAIAQVTNVTPFSGSRGFTPTAEHDMTTTIRKVFDALRDEGRVTFELNWDPANATHDATTGIEDAFRDGQLRDWQLVFPNTGAMTADFSGAVVDRSFQPYPANSGIGAMMVTIEVDGAVTWTP